MNLIYKKGSVDVSVALFIADSTDGTPETGVTFETSGIDLKYRRELSAPVAITEVTLAALTTAHADGGFLAIGNGWYRLDLPDAAFATGADKVLVFGTITGMVVYGPTIQLVDYDPEDGVRLGLTALPNAAADAAGGLPISDAGGLDLDAQIGTDIDAILVDTSTTLQAELDGIQADTEDIQAQIGTAGAGLTDLGGMSTGMKAEVQSEVDDALAAAMYLRRNTAQAGAAGTITLDASASATDDLYNGLAVLIVSGAGAGQARLILDYVGSTKVASIYPNWATNPASGSGFVIVPWAAVDLRLWRGSTPNILVSGRPDVDMGAKSGNVALSTQEKLDVNVEADTALGDYDAPTKAELDAVETKIDVVDTVVDAIKLKTDNLPGAIPKNVALSDFPFLMVDETDHVTPETGLTVTATISKDGGAFGACSNSVAEIANGVYKIDLTQTEMNADMIVLKFIATGADQRTIMLKTDA